MARLASCFVAQLRPATIAISGRTGWPGGVLDVGAAHTKLPPSRRVYYKGERMGEARPVDFHANDRKPKGAGK